MLKFYSILGVSLLTALVPMLSVNSNAAVFEFNIIASPTNNIQALNNYFKTTEEAISAFNSARAKDPTVTVTNKNLKLPANFANLSWQDQYYVVLNNERRSRKLLPMSYPIAKVNTIAAAYSKALNDSNQFTHTLNGTTPVTRLQADNDIKACMEFHPWIESLYYFKYMGYNFVTPKLVALQGLYAFLYNDASSNWGHRNHLLSNYQNNNKSSTHEGQSGYGMTTKVENGFTTYVLTHNTFDPNPTCKL